MSNRLGDINVCVCVCVGGWVGGWVWVCGYVSVLALECRGAGRSVCVGAFAREYLYLHKLTDI